MKIINLTPLSLFLFSMISLSPKAETSNLMDHAFISNEAGSIFLLKSNPKESNKAMAICKKNSHCKLVDIAKHNVSFGEFTTVNFEDKVDLVTISHANYHNEIANISLQKDATGEYQATEVKIIYTNM